jgi:hypothetical protein
VRRRIRGVTRSAHRLHYSPVRTESPSTETLHFFSDRASQTPFEGKCRPLEAILVALSRDRLAWGLEVYPTPRRVQNSRRNWTF